MEREAFLQRLRARAGGPPPTRPVAAMPLLPAVGYPRPLEDLAAAFAEAAGRAGWRLARATGLRGALEEVVGACGARRAAVSRDPETAGAAEALAELGVELAPPQHADLGVTGAAWALASTGTIVVDAARAGGRSVSLLPPVHLALVSPSRILPDAGALFRQMASRYPAGPPSQLVLITGPSRSADIELQLTVGVHGPTQVWAAILTEPATPSPPAGRR